MKRSTFLFCRITMVILCVVVFSSTDMQGKTQNTDKISPGQRADIIIIDGMKSFGPLEKASVEFPHEQHTKALSSKNKSCDTCHLQKDENFIPKFKRFTDKEKKRKELMNIYHDGCIACHGEMRLAGEKTGPVECDDCHAQKTKYVSFVQPMGFDNSLHYRHVKAHEKKCETCHHEYDEKNKKLYYAKEQEGTCRYCHKDQTEENRLSMRASSHIACINCHIRSQEKTEIKLPVNCSECHTLEAQKKIKKLDPVPRLERKQPDMVMIKTGVEELDAVGQNRMHLVPFNHKAHEEYNNTCRVCHHEQIKKCNECHTLNGTAAGKGVNLELAMHKKDSDRSCIGCHAAEYQQKPQCNGCHQFTPANKKMSNESCAACHMAIPEGAKPDENTAKVLLESRPEKPETYAQEDIPEKLVIEKFSKKYAEVAFPHRKIINKITEEMGDSKLAAYFHTEKGTTCSGCHHNAPLSKKITACSNCHAASFNEKDIHKPGIIGAYHLQCMECHKAMKIEKNGCVDCHKEKNQ